MNELIERALKDIKEIGFNVKDQSDLLFLKTWMEKIYISGSAEAIKKMINIPEGDE